MPCARSRSAFSPSSRRRPSPAPAAPPPTAPARPTSSSRRRQARHRRAWPAAHPTDGERDRLPVARRLRRHQRTTSSPAYYSASAPPTGWTTGIAWRAHARRPPGAQRRALPHRHHRRPPGRLLHRRRSTSLAAAGPERRARRLRPRDGVATWLTPAPTLPDTRPGDPALYAGRSADSRHVVIQSSKQLIPSVPAASSASTTSRRQAALASVPPARDQPRQPGRRLRRGRTANSYAYTTHPATPARSRPTARGSSSGWTASSTSGSTARPPT